MVSITKQNNHFIFEVKGIHKLWAFKNQITIAAQHILKVHHDLTAIKSNKGFRMPGTYLPGIITAGTFITHGDAVFWDVSNLDNCIVVELKDEQYKRLVIEVESPADAIALLSSS